jgi:hypothetical protein
MGRLKARPSSFALVGPLQPPSVAPYPQRSGSYAGLCRRLLKSRAGPLTLQPRTWRPETQKPEIKQCQCTRASVRGRQRTAVNWAGLIHMPCLRLVMGRSAVGDDQRLRTKLSNTAPANRSTTTESPGRPQPSARLRPDGRASLIRQRSQGAVVRPQSDPNAGRVPRSSAPAVAPANRAMPSEILGERMFASRGLGVRVPLAPPKSEPVSCRDEDRQGRTCSNKLQQHTAIAGSQT